MRLRPDSLPVCPRHQGQVTTTYYYTITIIIMAGVLVCFQRQGYRGLILGITITSKQGSWAE